MTSQAGVIGSHFDRYIAEVFLHSVLAEPNQSQYTILVIQPYRAPAHNELIV